MEKNKKKILYMYGEWLNLGGQETFTLNVLDNIKGNITIDLFTPYSSNHELIKKSIKKVNGKIYAYNGEFVNDRGNKKDFLKNTEDFLKKNAYKYDIVHIHSGSSFALARGAKLAKKYGIKKVIVHSHSTGNSNFKSRMVRFIFSFYYKKYVDFYCACSYDALFWKFSKRLINEDNHKIIKNGIDVDKFIFNEDIRKKYRKELNLDDKFVIVNIARLSQEKNQKFLIDTFNYIHQKDKSAILLLVGEGPDREYLEDRINELGLNESVILLGMRNDISEILQASDLFAFPSTFEGLGISAIESQATGLITICSEYIPKEAYITDLCKLCPLSNGYEAWADEILKYKNYERKNMINDVKNSGYGVQNMVDSLKELY